MKQYLKDLLFVILLLCINDVSAQMLTVFRIHYWTDANQT